MRVSILPGEYSGDPEATAMLQAFYSRSAEPIKSRLVKLGGDLSSVKKALKTYYVNYGHDSIAACGSVTVFIEGVSFLAAKVIQNNPLYNGQECSSRYLDFSKASIYMPSTLSNEGRFFQLQLLKFYEKTLNETITQLNLTSPETEKANRVYAFDLCRSLLPAGCLTNLSWHTTLRQLNEYTAEFLMHPMEEIRMIGLDLLEILEADYPSSNSVFRQEVTNNPCYFYADHGNFEPRRKVIINELSRDDRSYLLTREKYQRVPQHIAQKFFGTISTLIDYGSYRDIQRHRHGYQDFPMLSPSRGFEEYYVDGISKAAEDQTFAQKLREVLDPFEAWVFSPNKSLSSYDLQYVTPLGYKVPFKATWALDQLIYVAELRSGETVHPTAREFAYQIIYGILEPESIPVFFTERPSSYEPSVKRGNQDIKEL